jgi:hypothetical protein
MTKFFISYCSADRDIVKELVHDLLDDGHEPWFDQRLTGGQPWDKILSEIRERDIFVAALTPDYLESPACRNELQYASELQKPRLSVRLSDKVRLKALPLVIANLKCEDYRSDDKRTFKNLQQGIKALPKAPPLPDPLPAPPEFPISYSILLRPDSAVADFTLPSNAS